MYLEPKMVAENDCHISFSRPHAVFAQIRRLYYTLNILVNNSISQSGARARSARAHWDALLSIRHVQDSSGAHMSENKLENEEKNVFLYSSNKISTSRSCRRPRSTLV